MKPTPLRRLRIQSSGLSIADVVAVARHNTPVTLAGTAITAMKRSRAVVDRALKTGEPHYGINTGFGSLAKTRIPDADLATLQRNLIRSHTAGTGEPLPIETVRAMMLLLAASLSRGLSGVRPVVARTLVDMLNAGITPVVPSLGSVGASGDLAPLAAVALAAIGEGSVFIPRKNAAPIQRPAADALAAAGIRPLTLSAKEGLALINGTHLMAAEGALLCHDAARLLDAATLALAMSIDACRATHRFLDHRLYHARQHAPAAQIARSLRALLDGSTIATSHAENDPRVQDPYSLRAGPTILGSALDALTHIRLALTRELAAVTDNPLVFPKGSVDLGTRDAHLPARISSPADDIVSGANFHGMPIAMPLDFLAIALCHIAGVSERRTYLITGAFEPESRLKPFLAPHPGLQSGLMIAQYTAAACVNELIGLAAPATVANIPTCAGMEDYNSFGPRSAAKARRALDLARRVIAIELLCAAQGLDVHRPHRSGKAVDAAHRLIRSVVPKLTQDRPLTADIDALAALIQSGRLTA